MLKPYSRGVADDHGESLSLLKSIAQTQDEDLKEFSHEFHSTAVDIREIGEKITAIQGQTEQLQVMSTLETRLEELPKLNESIKMLPELLGNCVKMNFEDQFQKWYDLMINSQLNGYQRNAAMHNNVS